MAASWLTIGCMPTKCRNSKSMRTEEFVLVSQIVDVFFQT